MSDRDGQTRVGMEMREAREDMSGAMPPRPSVIAIRRQGGGKVGGASG